MVSQNGTNSLRTAISSHWVEAGQQHPEFMQRLEDLISQLRKAWIYYALSMNDESLEFSGIEGVYSIEHLIHYKLCKQVRLFENISFDDVFGLHRAHYGQINQYTGRPLSTDTANILNLAMPVTSACVVPYGQGNSQLNSKIATYKPVIQ